MVSSSFQIYLIGAERPLGQSLARLLSQQGILHKGVSLENRERLPALSAGRPYFVLLPSLLHPDDFDHIEYWMQSAEEQDGTVVLLSSMVIFNRDGDQTINEQHLNFAGHAMAQRLRRAEIAVAQHDKQELLRIGELLSLQGDDFASQILTQVRSQGSIALDMQQLFNPTTSDDVAQVVLAMLRQISCSDGLYGSYHFAGVEPVSAYTFGEVLLAQAGQYEDLSAVELTSQAGGMKPAVDVPVADNTHIFYTFGIKPKAWRSSLSALLQRYYQVEEK